MPVIDRKVVRARYTSLKLNELSSVDRPAQPGALAVILKRHEGEAPMPKTVEQLEGELAKALADNADMSAEVAALKAAKDKADQCASDAMEEAKEAKKALAAATDEVISVGGQELRKSVVGEGNFSVAKALRDERDMAQFEKRAETEFAHVAGTTAEKAAVLKSFAAMPEDARKAAESILTAAEKMAAAGFARLGHSDGSTTPTQKAAESTFTSKVAEIRKRDNISETEAMRKARIEFPAEFAAMNGDA
jgi:hypothetical protein